MSAHEKLPNILLLKGNSINNTFVLNLKDIPVNLNQSNQLQLKDKLLKNLIPDDELSDHEKQSNVSNVKGNNKNNANKNNHSNSNQANHSQGNNKLS